MERLFAVSRSFTPLFQKANFFLGKHATTVAFATLGTGLFIKGALDTKNWFSLRDSVTKGGPTDCSLNDQLDGLKKYIEEPDNICADNIKDLRNYLGYQNERSSSPIINKTISQIQDKQENDFTNKLKSEITASLKEIVSTGRYGIHKAIVFSVLGVGFLTCAAYSYRYVKALPLSKPAL